MKVKELELLLQDLEPEEALAMLARYEEVPAKARERLQNRYIKKLQALQKEQQRYEGMCSYEKAAYAKGIRQVCGLDEAGRGPLAGPVVAAAVILPPGVFIPGLNDSKKLSPHQRESLYDVITQKAVAYGIGMADEKCIDTINILNATKQAMADAVAALAVRPEWLLIDHVQLDKVPIPQEAFPYGDSLSVSIAAASILAKVTRDRYIDRMDEIYPQYGFARHKGYGTAEHIEAIKKYGGCPIHRVSFIKKFVTD